MRINASSISFRIQNIETILNNRKFSTLKAFWGSRCQARFSVNRNENKTGVLGCLVNVVCQWICSIQKMSKSGVRF